MSFSPVSLLHLISLSLRIDVLDYRINIFTWFLDQKAKHSELDLFKSYDYDEPR